MQKITTDQIRCAIKRNIWLIILPAILLGGLVLARTLLTAGSYEASAVLMVTSNDEGPMTYNKLILNEKLANVYGQFLESEDLYEEVAEKIGVKDLSGADIKNTLEYSVNPSGGTIAFTYTDTNEARSEDTLTLITENFRSYASKFLNMENIEYLQNVLVKESSKIRGIIFSIVGLILGALLGILILIIKEIISDKIHDPDDIRELGIEVLADLRDEKISEYAKIKRKIESTSARAVLGISPCISEDRSTEFTEKLADIMKAPIVDSKKVSNAEEELIDIKYKLNKFTQDYPYILVNELSVDDPITYDIAMLEDYKILLVDDKNLYKNGLIKQINEFERLGIKVLGVVYHS